MAFCGNCGTVNDDLASFCGSCGAKLKAETMTNQQPQQQPQYQPQQQPQYQPQYHQQPVERYMLRPPRTGWLTFVLVINWIGVALIGFVGLLFFLFFFILGILFLGIAALYAWLTLELNKYNNTARIIQLVLTGFGILTSLSTLPDGFLGIVLAGLQVFALAFHEETVRLFKPYG